MLALRTSARVASAARCLRQRPAARYSTANDTAAKGSSSSLPIVLAAAAIGAGGGAYYYTTLPNSSTSKNPSIPQEHVDHIVSKVQKGHDLSPEEEEKIRHACIDLKELYRKNAPKATHRGPSEYGHEKFASKNNENHVRHGVFSGKDFDNHIANHSRDPSKDFEIVEKKKEEESAKGGK